MYECMWAYICVCVEAWNQCQVLSSSILLFESESLVKLTALRFLLVYQPSCPMDILCLLPKCWDNSSLHACPAFVGFYRDLNSSSPAYISALSTELSHQPWPFSFWLCEYSVWAYPYGCVPMSVEDRAHCWLSSQMDLQVLLLVLLLFFKYLFYRLCLNLLQACVYAFHVHFCTSGGPRMASDALQLELWMVISLHVSAENCTQVLSKRSMCS